MEDQGFDRAYDKDQERPPTAPTKAPKNRDQGGTRPTRPPITSWVRQPQEAACQASTVSPRMTASVPLSADKIAEDPAGQAAYIEELIPLFSDRLKARRPCGSDRPVFFAAQNRDGKDDRQEEIDDSVYTMEVVTPMVVFSTVVAHPAVDVTAVSIILSQSIETFPNGICGYVKIFRQFNQPVLNIGHKDRDASAQYGEGPD